jgi:hypothetical protein
MSYRPITDFWFLTRAKLKGGKKYYGAYLGGFPERARRLIGCSIEEPLLHVCGGMAKFYPYAGGFGKWDKTMDVNPACEADYVHDCRIDLWPSGIANTVAASVLYPDKPWGGILIDPPYSESDAEQYPPGRDMYPNPHKLVETAIGAVRVGIKIGIIHYVVPRCPKNAKFIACVGVACGFGNRLRAYSVFERLE